MNLAIDAVHGPREARVVMTPAERTAAVLILAALVSLAVLLVFLAGK